MKRFAVAGVLAVTGLLAGQSASAEPGSATSEPSKFWGGISVKMWSATYTPAGNYPGTKNNELIPTFALGYDKVFITFTVNNRQIYTDPAYPGGTIRRMGESSLGIGYNFTPNFALVIGQKTNNDEYLNQMTGSSITAGETNYTTLAALVKWPIPDTDSYVFGSAGIGQGKTNNPGITASQKYNGFELGLGYKATQAVRLTAAYKAESFGLPYLAAQTANFNNMAANVWQNGTAKKAGFYVGAGYAF